MPLDRFDLYELCVQDPPRLAEFLAAVHGGRGGNAPKVLREDFCGPAAVARHWALERGRRSIAVDRDAEPPARAQGVRGVEVVVSDVLRVRRRADVIAALNFAVCELHTRAELVRYLRAVRASLHAGGVFVCDLYGGREQWAAGAYQRKLRGPAREEIVYTWEQREADPLSGRVLNAISFEVTQRGTPAKAGARTREGAGKTGGRTVRHPDAFVYDWRLWSIAELREAMAEAGLVSEVYDSLGDARDDRGRLYVHPLRHGDELEENWVVYVAARRRQGDKARKSQRRKK